MAASENLTDVQWKDMKFKEKCKYLVDNVTVEPILSCYIFPIVLASLATQNLNLEKACRVNLGYSEDICLQLTLRNTANYSGQEQAVQKLVGSMGIWKSALQSSLPALLILFVGSWSDRSGRRKPFMLLPIIGEFLTSVGLILCTYFFIEWPMEVAGLFEGLFPAITGGTTAMLMSVFSYMGDMTSVEMRTTRIGIVNIFVSLSAPIGLALSGILLQLIGYYGIFSLVALLYMLGFVYGYLRLREARTPAPMPDNFIKDFFDPKHVSETFKVAFKSRKGNLKICIILIMVLYIAIMGPVRGEGEVGYLFARYQFNWDEKDFGYYNAYGIVINLIGTLIVIGVFIKRLKMDDTMIGLIACGSRIISCLIYAFAKTTLVFYLVPLIDMFSGASVIAMRSLASKLVPSDELGKINSLFGVCEAVVPFIYSPVYNLLYINTISVLPGAFFLLSAALTIPAALIFLCLNYLHCNDKSKNQQRKNSSVEIADLVGVENKGFETASITEKTENDSTDWTKL